MRFLDEAYKKVLDGIPRVSPPVKTLAEDYLKKHKTKEAACNSKCSGCKSNCASKN